MKNTGMMRQDTLQVVQKDSEAYENTDMGGLPVEEAALWDKFHIATPEQKEKS